MLRIALFLLLAILILTAVSFPKFRRVLGMTVVLLIGAIGVIIWQDTEERSLEFERISVNQAQLSQMRVRSGLNSRSFVVGGRIQNLATDYTILSVMLQATVKDCESGTCETVGQEQRTFPIEIPPGQSRDFSVTIPFSVAPQVQTDPVWDYEILKVRAR